MTPPPTAEKLAELEAGAIAARDALYDAQHQVNVRRAEHNAAMVEAKLARAVQRAKRTR